MASRKKQPPGPRRSKKAANPAPAAETVIDLAAADPETSPAADKTPPQPTTPRQPLILAGLMIAVAAFGMAAAALFLQMSRPDPSSMIQNLTAQVSSLVADLEASTEATDSIVSRSEVEALATRLGGEIKTLAAAVETLAERPVTAPAAAPDLHPLLDRSNRLEETITTLNSQLAAMPAPRDDADAAPAEGQSPGWGDLFGDFFRITRIDEEQP